MVKFQVCSIYLLNTILVIMILSLSLSCSDDCGDSDRVLDLRGLDLSFTLIDDESGARVIQNDEGTGLFAPIDVSVLDQSGNAAANFSIQDGALKYGVPTNFDLMGPDTLNFTFNYNANNSSIPFELFFNIASGKCFDTTLGEVYLIVQEKTISLSHLSDSRVRVSL